MRISTFLLVFLLLPAWANAGRGVVRTMFAVILQKSVEMQEAGFVDCVEDQEEVPQAEIEVVLSGSEDSLNKGQFNEIQLSKAQAEIPQIERDQTTSIFAHVPNSNEESWKFVWFVFAPRHSKKDAFVPTVGQEFKLRPETFGSHELVLVAQDSRGRCSYAEKNVAVAVNQPVPKSVSLPEFRLPSMPWAEMIEMDEAQKSGLGEGITVAVIGTGIDYLNPELHPALWSKACASETSSASEVKSVNTSTGASTDPRQKKCEIADNGIDDDGNGFVDDVMGWDFRENDPYPFDYDFHETGVAGFIAGLRFGVAPKAKIMPLKTGKSVESLRDIPKAIKYAVDEGAKIINISTGFFQNDNDITSEIIANLQEAVSFAEERGVLIVVSAGNGRINRAANIDQDPFYPSVFSNKNIVSVAAVNWDGKRANYSNYGEVSVDVAAPGGQLPRGIMMLAPQVPNYDPFVKTQGTSFAAPIVSGSIALALSAKPERYLTADGKVNFEVLHQYLQNSGKPSESLKGVVKSARVFSVKDLVK